MTPLVTSLEFLFALVLMLGVLITVHEFGHFAAAKLCGVRVLKFSIGFGPPIGMGRFRLAWRRGGTEYVVAWFPLGGFVKMLGEQPGEEGSAEACAEPERTLGSRPSWQKLAIVFAGPAMNLILPVFVFTGTLAFGIERREPVVGTVEPASPAAEAGLRPGDRILAVEGEPIAWWEGLEETVRESPDERLALRVAREERTFETTLRAERRSGLDAFRLQSEVGWLGLRHSRQEAVLGVPDGGSPAARAGLRSGDRVVAVAGEPVEAWTGFARAYAAAGPGPVEVTVERGSGEDARRRTLTVPAAPSLEALGAIPAVVLVDSVREGMPAARAGLRPGDLIVAVDGRPIGSFATFQETVLGSGGRELELRVAREGETRTLTLSPELANPEGDGVEQELYLIGITGTSAALPGATREERVWNPLVSVPRATGMTLEVTRLYLAGLGKLVSGEISRRNLGGPIEIARQSHRALEAGWDRFLNLLVLISINLGILNLLPIPVLDGGQALLFAVEGVQRRPLSLRTRELVQQLGLMVLVAIMGFAFWNDFTRHWSSFLEWLKNL